jgi:hypothetical protein
VSPYGVHDLTGNVDEWVVNEEGSFNGPEFDSGLKGGYWGPVRNRCRPMTTDHNHWHRGYQIGFRCCSEIQGNHSAPECVANVQTVVSPEVLSAAALAIPSATGPLESVARPPSKPARPTEGRAVAEPTAPAAVPSETPTEPSAPLPEQVPSAADAGPAEAEVGETPSSVDNSDPENPY